jgi:hypothetical protein
VFAEEHKAERGAPWNVPSMRQLAAIAWRHLLEDGGVDLARAEASSTRAS